MGPAHPNSLSTTTLHVAGGEVRAVVRSQSLTLLETFPEIDRDGDEDLSPAELAAHRDELATYVCERLELATDEGALACSLVDLRRDPGRGSVLDTWIELELLFSAPFESGSAGELSEFHVSHRLFLEQNPGHQDFTEVSWADEPPVRVLFGNGYHEDRFRNADRRRPGVILDFVRLGIDHILGGWDHLAFLVVLLVAARGVRSLLGVVTAFTLAHSITLALAALGVVDLPGHLVELAIALSIAYVGCDNLLRRESRTPWPEALGFGLLHGFGFAGFLGDALAGETLLVSALFGFNLGVELGQIAFVVVVAGAILILKRFSARRAHGPHPEQPRALEQPQAPERPALSPAWLRTSASALVALLGFYWFIERAGWF